MVDDRTAHRAAVDAGYASLQGYIEQWGHEVVSETQKRYADDITVQELVRLRVENERLREALQFYADKDTYAEKIRPHYLGDYEAKDIDGDEGEIARAALQQNEAQILATNKYEAEGRN